MASCTGSAAGRTWSLSSSARTAWPGRPIRDALRAGQFFVTTGEVLLREFTVGGKQSGETLAVKAGDRPELHLKMEWTFPLRFAEVISGDGRQVYRERIELMDTGPFGE